MSEKKTIRVNIVSAEREIFSGTVNMVFATGILGELGIAPGHAPLLTLLKPGLVRVQKADADEEIFYVSGGILEVQPNSVSILSDTATRAEDIDEAQANDAKEAAARHLAEHKSNVDYATVARELAEATAQLHAIASLRKHLKHKN